MVLVHSIPSLTFILFFQHDQEDDDDDAADADADDDDDVKVCKIAGPPSFRTFSVRKVVCGSHLCVFALRLKLLKVSIASVRHPLTSA